MAPGAPARAPSFKGPQGPRAPWALGVLGPGASEVLGHEALLGVMGAPVNYNKYSFLIPYNIHIVFFIMVTLSHSCPTWSIYRGVLGPPRAPRVPTQGPRSPLSPSGPWGPCKGYGP